MLSRVKEWFCNICFMCYNTMFIDRLKIHNIFMKLRGRFIEPCSVKIDTFRPIRNTEKEWNNDTACHRCINNMHKLKN